MVPEWLSQVFLAPEGSGNLTIVATGALCQTHALTVIANTLRLLTVSGHYSSGLYSSILLSGLDGLVMAYWCIAGLGRCGFPSRDPCRAVVGVECYGEYRQALHGGECQVRCQRLGAPAVQHGRDFLLVEQRQDIDVI